MLRHKRLLPVLILISCLQLRYCVGEDVKNDNKFLEFKNTLLEVKNIVPEDKNTVLEVESTAPEVKNTLPEVKNTVLGVKNRIDLEVKSNIGPGVSNKEFEVKKELPGKKDSKEAEVKKENGEPEAKPKAYARACVAWEAINPCTCYQHNVKDSWIKVVCQKMRSFNEIIQSLRNKIDRSTQIQLAIELSDLEDLAERKFSDIQSHIIQLWLNKNKLKP